MKTDYRLPWNHPRLIALQNKARAELLASGMDPERVEEDLRKPISGRNGTPRQNYLRLALAIRRNRAETALSSANSGL